MSDNRTAADISEQLFQAIDAIVMERLRVLPYDKTVIATIVENKDAPYGKYKVTTDDNITFYAFADTSKYALKEKVYIRIPQGDYTKQKIITGWYIPDGNTQLLKDVIVKKTSETATIYDELDRYDQLMELKEADQFLEQLKIQLLALNKNIKFDKSNNIKNSDEIFRIAHFTNNTDLLNTLEQFETVLEQKLKILNGLK